MEKAQPFSAEEAYALAQRDFEIAHAAADYVASLGGTLTAVQREEVIALILRMRYDSHIRDGRLEQRTIMAADVPETVFGGLADGEKFIFTSGLRQGSVYEKTGSSTAKFRLGRIYRVYPETTVKRVTEVPR